MDFLIQNAWAQAAPAAGSEGLLGLLFPLSIFLVLYIFFVRPQMKRQKEHKLMVEGMVKGDEIVTNGGLLGRVTEVGENFVILEICDETKVKVQKDSVSAAMPKGTYEKML